MVTGISIPLTLTHFSDNFLTLVKTYIPFHKRGLSKYPERTNWLFEAWSGTTLNIYLFNLPSTQAPGTPGTLQTWTNSIPAPSNRPWNPASVLSFPPIVITA